MKVKLLKSPYFNALVKSLLVLVCIHVITITISFIQTKQIDDLNIFNIIGISKFYLPISDGFNNFLLSLLFLVLVYFFFLNTNTKKHK